ncbi:DUF1285 domain-containing protein [Pseudoroseomonas cervicalis]|nr:DUF1285 domain-containing protein [Pseudoroseomonas cervicalis]WBV43565.1 DUF1285 domain-containing protein [Pseudoroseomonas cervicalis]
MGKPMTTGRMDEALKQSAIEQGCCLRAQAPEAVARKPAGKAAKAPARPRHECGSLDMRIAKDGSWHYKGSPIGRKELVCLFASVLKREPDGSYWLETPAERGTIEVEDAPFVAVEVFWRRCEGRQCLTFRTNLDEMVTADADHPIRVAIDPRSRQPRPYVTVRPGLEARINRAVFYELVALAEPERVQGREVLGVWSEGIFFPIDEVPAVTAG